VNRHQIPFGACRVTTVLGAEIARTATIVILVSTVQIVMVAILLLVATTVLGARIVQIATIVSGAKGVLGVMVAPRNTIVVAKTTSRNMPRLLVVNLRKQSL